MKVSFDSFKLFGIFYVVYLVLVVQLVMFVMKLSGFMVDSVMVKQLYFEVVILVMVLGVSVFVMVGLLLGMGVGMLMFDFFIIEVVGQMFICDQLFVNLVFGCFVMGLFVQQLFCIVEDLFWVLLVCGVVVDGMMFVVCFIVDGIVFGGLDFLMKGSCL